MSIPIPFFQNPLFFPLASYVALAQKTTISTTHAHLPYQIYNEVKKLLVAYYPRMGWLPTAVPLSNMLSIDFNTYTCSNHQFDLHTIARKFE
jgi:hypothetical protein